MTYTRLKHEVYLNDMYSSTYSYNDVLDNFSHYYKTDKIAEKYLCDYYSNNMLGTLQRKKDPIAFNVSYWDRKREVEK